MKKNDVIEMVKTIGGCAAAWGTTLIVSSFVDSLRDDEDSTSKKVLMGIAGMAIAGLAAKKVLNYTYDGIGKTLKPFMTEEETLEESK